MQIEMFHKEKCELEIWKYMGAGGSDSIPSTHDKGWATTKKEYSERKQKDGYGRILKETSL